MVSALGSECSAEVTTGTAAAGAPYWLENITHQGMAPYAPDPSTYQVFRNVKDYGATGDGTTDDTAAINAAIYTGDRCGGGNCSSSTTTPALVYFPAGTYLVSSAIQAYYYTALIGDARTPPTLLAAANFTGMAVIDADPYGANGANWYVNQDNFYRSVRNLVIDLTQMPASATATGIHWQVSQSTSLVNVVVNMSTEEGNNHQGLFMEDGSGGFMGDIVFNGGKYGIWVGNQQFTVRNITVNNANTAIYGLWSWGWTYQRVTINNCQIGFDLLTGGLSNADQTVGAEAIIDAVVTNTPIFIQTSSASNGTLAGSLVLNNIQLNNVPTAVSENGTTILEGGTMTIDSWGQGNVYAGTDGNGTFTQGDIYSAYKAPSLLDSSGMIFGKGHPQYINYAVDQIMSVKSQGAVGDGVTDDTDAINAVFSKYAGCYIIFFDAGVYKVTGTINVPAGSQIVGEAWSVIMGGGSYFNDMANPQPVVQVGAVGSVGVAEISDIVFTTQGPTAGAIVLEWNVHEPAGQQGACGMWDSHIRLGGAMGTNLQTAECPAGSVNTTACAASFLGIHLTSGSTAYLEGTWVWLADHDMDGTDQLTLFSGRGILSQSAGPVWMMGTSEHHVLYQYSLVGASDHYMGLIQTETPYFQPDPAPPAPFNITSTYSDPTYENGMNMAWALWVESSTDVIIFGAGHYSFFQNYGQDCLANNTCQTQIVNTDSSSSVTIYSLSTVGTTYQLSVEQNGIINWADNIDGFASTVTVWSPSS
ncbi:glycoside hydrolase family 55 protein [Leucogyrophana mollusca]|uniref:Glycoside hydrolase family 55 protein n=1 Tax=Leucogyrophana mollusca TaxID=85980 RepID=A0ACB8BXN3_9AGAM|nr:glycoside hydrolase family 55 protein [Leucogyrophana mollusca]